MQASSYSPPWLLRNGLAMTLYTTLRASRDWEKTVAHPEPPYQETIFTGAEGVPIFGWIAIPDNPRSTLVGTYGIIGSLENQWFLRLLGRKAYARGYAVVLFDWRAHGKTAELSPTLMSDGLYEGDDFVCIAAQAKAMGCPAPFWFTGYSLGGQLALWGVKAAEGLRGGGERESGRAGEWETGRAGERETGRVGDGEMGRISNYPLPLSFDDIAGAAAICPNLDSHRTLSYLVKHPTGKYLERSIARELKRLAWRIYQAHPAAIDPDAIARVHSIETFDQELVIKPLGFPSVEAYYEASSGLHLLPHLHKPTLILYAADDPLFDPTIVPDLQAACDRNPAINLVLTRHGGHVSHLSSKANQRQQGDPDPWWIWNRVLEWADLMNCRF